MAYQSIINSIPPGQTYNATKPNEALGIDPASLKEAYDKGDMAGFNAMIAGAGISETGASNVMRNLGANDPAAAVATMKQNGAMFAGNATPQENTQWNANTGGAGIVTGGAPKSTLAASPERLGAPTPWNVTPEQTVEARINSIINGTVGQQARAGAVGEMNARGLSNSTMAITAGDDAAYRAAIPIATADASTFSRAAGYNADQSNQFATHNVDAGNTFALADKNNAAQMSIAQLQARTQTTVASLNNDSQVLANKVQQDNQKLLSTNDKAASAFGSAMNAINNIQNNNQMDAQTKTRAIAQVWADVQTQLKVLGAVAGIDLTGQLNFANMPGFDASGNYIGFPEPKPESVTTNDQALNDEAVSGGE